MRALALQAVRCLISPSKRLLRGALAGIMATALCAGMLVGALSGVASATPVAFSLNMTSGSFGVQGATPTAIPTQTAALAGNVDSATGAVTGATVTIPTFNLTNSQGTATIKIY
jgi:hypothetical protein